jgi:polar amino acid transport system substrate-binding protein
MTRLGRRLGYWLASLLALSLALLSGWAIGADTRPVLVASFRDNPPDMVSYCGGKHSGPLRYILEEAAARIGYRIEWKRLSLADSFREIKAGSIDILPYLHTKTAERAAIGRFSVSLGAKPLLISFMMRNDDSRSVKQFADLAAFSIGYRKDSFYFTEFHESKMLKTVPYEQEVQMGRDFINGRLDMIAINNKQAAERAFLGLGFNEFKYAELSYQRDAQLHVMYSHDKSKQELFDLFDQVLLQMKEGGLIADIYRSFDTMTLK